MSVETPRETAAGLAIASPARGLVVFAGSAGSGKSAALLRRAERIAGSGAVLLTSANPHAARRLAASALPPGVAARSLESLAIDLLRAGGFGTSLSPDLEIVTEARAAAIFEGIGRRLFALDWTQFVTPEIDPEITGLRAPERFAAAAFRLIRRLRVAGLDPERFRTICLAGATEFYGRLPNFGNPDLKTYTKPKYRDSLLAGAAELERQRLRELDLARILFHLYESYEASLAGAGCLTAADAVFEAARFATRDPRVAARALAAFPAVCVDDAQDLTTAQRSLLVAVYGESLSGCTFAGDARQQTRAFSGSLGEAAFKGAEATFVFEGFVRGRAAIANVATRGGDARAPAPVRTGDLTAPPDVAFARARDVADEARIVADFVTEALGDGTPPGEIALIARSLAAAPPYLDALLARDVPCDLAGDGSIFDYAPVRDALGALWTLADPFRHDYLLRTLESGWMRLADASIARLCAEPSQPQALLFELPEEPSETRSRWDRRRDLRLGRNVTRGDADLDLTPEARERLARLREAIERWQRLEERLPLPALVRAIVAETVLATPDPGARGRFAADLIERFLAFVDDHAAARPLATLHDFLEEIDAVVDREESLLSIEPTRADAVTFADVEAVKGREFARVFVVDVRAGAFPRYYVPDAFVFTPRLGIVPKENVGDAAAARTAKFTYAMYKTQGQEKFLDEERRAFYTAASRAKERLVVTASGRATKAVAAPEILEELRRAGLPGTADLTHG